VVDKDPRSQPDFSHGSYADEVDDTPVMESFAEGHKDGKR